MPEKCAYEGGCDRKPVAFSNYCEEHAPKIKDRSTHGYYNRGCDTKVTGSMEKSYKEGYEAGYKEGYEEGYSKKQEGVYEGKSGSKSDKYGESSSKSKG